MGFLNAQSRIQSLPWKARPVHGDCRKGWRKSSAGASVEAEGNKQAFEFQYMTAGLTAYLDLTTAEEHQFRKGDFYVIEPGAVYAQKSAPGTEILFIKVPPGNDKVPLDTTPEVEGWFREPIKE